MTTSLSPADRAARLLALHDSPELLVLVNVWDAASARTVATVDRVRALATASHSIADAHGVADGEALGRDAMIAAVATICRVAGDLPVSADLERGYGATPDDVQETIALALDAGAVGCNIEDSLPDRTLRDLDDAAARIAAARAAGDRAGVHVVINARTDEFLAGDRDIDVAIQRGRALLEAGGDCVFVPGVADSGAIARLGEAFDGRLSIFASPKAPPLEELAGLGVARVSVGPGSLGVAMRALQDAAKRLVGLGAYPESLSHRVPSA